MPPKYTGALTEEACLASAPSISDDFKAGISLVTIEIFRVDNPRNRRRVYRQLELPEDQRIRGIFKISERDVACVPSVVRADLLRRAGVVPPAEVTAVVTPAEVETSCEAPDPDPAKPVVLNSTTRRRAHNRTAEAAHTQP